MKRTYKPVTRLSGEHVIIAQLQGSTESSSQLLRAPWGSFNPFLIKIKATTARTNWDQEFKNPYIISKTQKNPERKTEKRIKRGGRERNLLDYELHKREKE